MKTFILPTLALLALGGAALAQNAPPQSGNRQAQSSEERFKQYDANSDGKVTLAEYKATRSGTRTGETQASREERFKTGDTNKDGSLSLAEYKAIPRAQGGTRRSGDSKRSSVAT